MDQNATSIQAGRLGAIEVRERQVILGPPLIMNKTNIDEFNF
jgi:rhamnose transport system permease protein